jgi:hypothetical protein
MVQITPDRLLAIAPVNARPPAQQLESRLVEGNALLPGKPTYGRRKLLIDATHSQLHADAPVVNQKMNLFASFYESFWRSQAIFEQGCQHNHSLTHQWLSSKGIDNPAIGMALLSQGGGCDCEIVLNIELDAIYP